MLDVVRNNDEGVMMKGDDVEGCFETVSNNDQNVDNIQTQAKEL